MLNTIYKITNNINNKVYIGKTALTIEERFQQHKRDFKKEKYKDRPFYKAINKYGIENFSIEEIETNIQDEDIDNKEQYYIKKYRSYVGFDDCNGYNATLGGDGKKYKEYNIQDIIQKYNECHNLVKTGEAFNLDRSYIKKLLIANNVQVPSQKHAIVQVDLEKDIIINIFESLSAAARAMHTSSNTYLRKCTKSKTHKGYGYRWYDIEDWYNIHPNQILSK